MKPCSVDHRLESHPLYSRQSCVITVFLQLKQPFPPAVLCKRIVPSRKQQWEKHISRANGDYKSPLQKNNIIRRAGRVLVKTSIICSRFMSDIWLYQVVYQAFGGLAFPHPCCFGSGSGGALFCALPGCSKTKSLATEEEPWANGYLLWMGELPGPSLWPFFLKSWPLHPIFRPMAHLVLHLISCRDQSNAIKQLKAEHGDPHAHTITTHPATGIQW